MEGDSTKRVVINKEARKIVVQRKPQVHSSFDNEKSAMPTVEVKEISFESPPADKKAKLTNETNKIATTESTPALASVQQKLSALERLKSLNFSAPKSAVNPFSLTTPTKAATLEIHKNDQKVKKPIDNRPLTPLAPLAPTTHFQPKKPPQILDDVKPKPLFDFATNAVKFFEPPFPVRPPFPHPQQNDLRQQNRPDFLKKQNDFVPRQSQSPPNFGPNVNFLSRFPHSTEPPHMNPFFARSGQSPTPVFNTNDVWLNPIYVKKDYLEREKLENLQITDIDLNSLSVVGLKNTIEYLLEIESDLSTQSARLNAQIKTVQRGLETFPNMASNNFEYTKPKAKKVRPKSLEKDNNAKTFTSAVSDENFTKALYKAINDQADAKKKEMNFPPSTLDVGHQNEKEFNSNMAMAKIFFAGMVSGLTEKMRTDSKSY